MDSDLNSSTNKLLYKISFCVSFIFMASGAIFLFFPEQHYNPDGWGVLIKYILYAILLFLLVIYIINNGELSIVSIMIGLIWVIAILTGLIAGAGIERSILYLAPVPALLAPPLFQKKILRIAFPIILLAVLGALYEYFVLGGFARFHPTSYRGISIFINPNNLGITEVVPVSETGA